MTTDQIIAQVELQKGLLDALRDKATFILSKNDCESISQLEDKSKIAVTKGETEAQELWNNVLPITKQWLTCTIWKGK